MEGVEIIIYFHRPFTSIDTIDTLNYIIIRWEFGQLVSEVHNSLSKAIANTQYSKARGINPTDRSLRLTRHQRKVAPDCIKKD